MRNIKEAKKPTIQLLAVDKIIIRENLFNYKQWFNGLKKFSAIKVIPSIHKR